MDRPVSRASKGQPFLAASFFGKSIREHEINRVYDTSEYCGVVIDAVLYPGASGSIQVLGEFAVLSIYGSTPEVPTIQLPENVSNVPRVLSFDVSLRHAITWFVSSRNEGSTDPGIAVYLTPARCGGVAGVVFAA